MLFNNDEEGQNLPNDLDDSNTVDDTTTESESPTDEGDDTVTLTRAELDAKLAERAKEQDKRWKDRLKGVEGNEDTESSPKKADKEVKETDTTLMERLDRQELRAEGIRDKAEQDIILKYAKIEGLEPVDALDSSIVKAALKDYRNKAATPAPGRRTATGQRDEVSYWADQTLKGKRAPTAEMRSKVLAHLAKNR